MVERVLARAAELQAAQEAEPGETISEERLLEIAREVGLDPTHMRQAIAEQRMATVVPTSDRGVLLEALGPSLINAQRTVRGTPLAVLDRIEAVLPTLERLAIVRRQPDRLILERRHDPLGNLLRSVGVVGGRRLDLVRADTIHITATRIDDERLVLRIEAVMHRARREARTSVFTVAGFLAFLCAGIAVPVTLFALMVPAFALMTTLLLVAISAGLTAWAWIGFRRGYHALIDRVAQRIDAVLDDVEHDRMQPPRSVVDRLLGA